jgi:hypothetical protein
VRQCQRAVAKQFRICYGRDGNRLNKLLVESAAISDGILERRGSLGAYDMTMGYYRATDLRPRYNEKDLFMSDRFYPGELGGIIILEIASLLLWAVAIWGLVRTY